MFLSVPVNKQMGRPGLKVDFYGTDAAAVEIKSVFLKRREESEL